MEEPAYQGLVLLHAYQSLRQPCWVPAVTLEAMATLVSTLASANACHVYQHDDSSQPPCLANNLETLTPDREAESYKHSQANRMSTEHQLFALRHFIDRARFQKQPLFAAFVDLKKAYDSVQHPLLWAFLQRKKVHGKMLAAIQYLCSGGAIAQAASAKSATLSCMMPLLLLSMGAGLAGLHRSSDALLSMASQAHRWQVLLLRYDQMICYANAAVGHLRLCAHGFLVLPWSRREAVCRPVLTLALSSCKPGLPRSLVGPHVHCRVEYDFEILHGAAYAVN